MTSDDLKKAIGDLICKNSEYFYQKFGVRPIAGDDEGVLFALEDVPEDFSRSYGFDIQVINRENSGGRTPKKNKGQEIPVEIFKEGGIYCLSDGCPYRKECANHRSAGDFRSEDGFTPELTVEGEKIFCATINEKALEIRDFDFGSDLPANYNQLGRGSLYFNKEKRLNVYRGPYDDDDVEEYRNKNAY